MNRVRCQANGETMAEVSTHRKSFGVVIACQCRRAVSSVLSVLYPVGCLHCWFGRCLLFSRSITIVDGTGCRCDVLLMLEEFVELVLGV